MRPSGHPVTSSTRLSNHTFCAEKDVNPERSRDRNFGLVLENKRFGLVLRPKIRPRLRLGGRIFGLKQSLGQNNGGIGLGIGIGGLASVLTCVLRIFSRSGGSRKGCLVSFNITASNLRQSSQSSTRLWAHSSCRSSSRWPSAGRSVPPL